MNNKDFNLLLQMEEDLCLNEKCIFGFNYWQYIRVEYFNKINTIVNNLDAPFVYTNLSKFDKVKKGLKYYLDKEYYIYSKLRKSDYLFLCDPMRRCVNGIFICSYTHYIADFIKGSKTFIERPFNYKHLRPVPNEELVYLDKEYMNRAIYYEIHKRSRKKKAYLKEINDCLNNINSYLRRRGINVNFDIVKETEYLWMLFLRYYYMKSVFNRILKKINPKVIFEVQYYNFENMIINEIAKELGIITIELQHGVISPYHFAYNASRVLGNVTLPNYLLTFGDYWNEIAKYPIEKNRIISFGFPYYEKMKNSARSLECFPKKNILFLSQGDTGIKLSQLALELSEIMDNGYHIIYKVHPGEFSNYRSKYQKIIDNERISVIADEHGLYDLFASCFAIVGVSSTSIFEGLGFRRKCYLYNISEVEHILSLVEKNYAILVNTAEEIMNDINKPNDNLYSESDFWMPCEISKIKSILGRTYGK